jgi:hypothetical protein
VTTTNGTSVLGNQSLLTGGIATNKTFQIQINNQVQPPPKVVGYYHMYAYTVATPAKFWVLRRGILSSPGLWEIIDVTLNSANTLIRVDVDWDIAGLTWTCNIV